ncbi:MAG: S8 family serine peptidase [Polyangiaceae bacterium]
MISPIRVAIVDSGVDSAHPFFANARLSTYSVEQKGVGLSVEPCGGGDGSGHGTACAGIVHKVAPFAEIVSIRALGPDGRGSRDALIAALRFCVREHVNVVNLSLGIDLPKNAPVRPTDAKSILDMYEVADEAFSRGVVMVAAGPNAGTMRTYPSKAKSLIGVGRGAFDDPERLELAITSEYELVAAGIDIVAPAAGGGERKWSGTSFACPHVAGHAARVVAKIGTSAVIEVRAELHNVARRWAAEHGKQNPATSQEEIGS